MITATVQRLNWGSFHTLPCMTVVTGVCRDSYVLSLDCHHRSYISSDHMKFSVYKHLEREGNVCNCASWAAEIRSFLPC
jgi:hypothetical protein